MIDFIQNCPHLEVLDMSNSTLLTDQSLQVLSTCILYLIVIIIQLDTPQLHTLILDNNQITDHGLTSVLNTLPLTYLSIAFCSSITG